MIFAVECVAVPVEFRLLGDVQAYVDGRPLDLGHARQWGVLVALLVDANRPVSVDQLIDRAWGDRTPQRARSALYTYLSRLRRALAVSEDVCIVRRRSGYVLALDSLAVDVHRFCHLTSQARTADNDADALALLEQALNLWRGEPFATLDTPWLVSVRNDLDRHRFAAQLDRNDLALRRGDHSHLLAGLSAAATVHPLDERVAGQLMVALYRSGRQADALTYYEQTRIRLADQLGADPSPPLQQLHRQILQADAVLTASTDAVATGTVVRSEETWAVPVPRQLPAPVRHFTGRAVELYVLSGLLDEAAGESPTVVISTITGTAGVGKTTLAVYWAHRVTDQFPDGQLYVNLRGFDPTGAVMDPAEAIRGFLDALHVPPHRVPTGLDAQAALYRSLLADKRILIVLDNARDAEQVRPLLPASPTALVIVTSRSQLTSLVASQDAHPIVLDLLSADEARELLARRLGTDRVGSEPDAVNDIITSCARLPLALAIAAAHAASRPRFPLAALAGELHEAGLRLDALTGDHTATDVRAAFSWSYQALTVEAARLFRLLGLHPGPDISAAATVSLVGLPPSRIRLLLAELTHAHLVTEHTPGRYTLHDLLSAYAIEQVRDDPDQERRTAIHRMLDHYLHTAHIADRLVEAHRDQIKLASPRKGVIPETLVDRRQATAWFTVEEPVLLAMVQYAAAAGFGTHAWQLAWTLATFLPWQGRWRDWADTQRVALTCARRHVDIVGQAHAHRELGLAYARIGVFADAQSHLQHALDLFIKLEDAAAEARTHRNIGWLLERQRLYDQALSHNRAALDRYDVVGHRRGKARALNGLGWCHAQLGDHQQALVYCQQALDLQYTLGDRNGQAHTWDSLGYLHSLAGRHAKAAGCYHHALSLYHDLGDRYGEVETLTLLGYAHQAAGHFNATRDAWQRALAILDDLDHPDADQMRTKLRSHRPSSHP